MRIIKEIPHPHYRTTIFHWNNKYIIKLETPNLEQTFKIDQYDLASDDDVLKILDDEFLQQAMKRFEDMAASVGQALEKL